MQMVPHTRNVTYYANITLNAYFHFEVMKSSVVNILYGGSLFLVFNDFYKLAVKLRLQTTCITGGKHTSLVIYVRENTYPGL